MKKLIFIIVYTILLVIATYRLTITLQEIYVEGNTAYVCVFDHVDVYELGDTSCGSIG